MTKVDIYMSGPEAERTAKLISVYTKKAYECVEAGILAVLDADLSKFPVSFLGEKYIEIRDRKTGDVIHPRAEYA